MKKYLVKFLKILWEGIKHHWVSLVCAIYFFIAFYVWAYFHPDLVNWMEEFYTLPSEFIFLIVLCVSSIVSGFIFCFSIFLHVLEKVLDVIIDHFKKAK